MLNKPIEIFYACDEGFLKYTVVSLHSMIKNADKTRSYHVHILNTGFSEEKKALLKSEANDAFAISFDDVTPYLGALTKDLPIRDYYSKSTYFRLFISDMYPDIDKALYIDGDTIVNGDISELFDTDISLYDAAACHEQAMVQEDVYGTYVEKCLGINRHRFFNAGVLLINCKRFRENRMLKRFGELLETYDFRVTQDEDYLNVMFKDRVLFLPQCWNSEVFGEIEYSEEDSRIIHYIMVSKPWRYREARYGESFWKNAKETAVYDTLIKELDEYTDGEKARDYASLENLEALAKKESERPDTYIARITALCDKGRVEVVEKIKALEKEGCFDEDVEDDPPTRPIKPGEVDYFCKKLGSKIARKLAYRAARRFLNGLIKKEELIISEIKGIENLKNLDTGAVITCNHFNAFDSFAMQVAYEAAGYRDKKKKLYRVIREGNYTSFPGFYGTLMRHCNTLPLASTHTVLREFNKAVEKLLSDGHFVLVYPEQSMWWNYRKPKPTKPGAYRFAARCRVPVVPCFITMRDSAKIGADGFPRQEYTIHIGKAIYPEEGIPISEAADRLREENNRVWREIYEREYGIELKYGTV